jgi:hypothetical protein
MTIKTHFDYPPIPIRSFDWSAIDDDTYDGTPGCPIGRGETERAAIADLLEQLEERQEPYPSVQVASREDLANIGNYFIARRQHLFATEVEQ